MEIPLPEVSHELSISIDGHDYDFQVTANAMPLMSYYALVLTFDVEDKFYRDFDIEEVYLNQFYPVENAQSAISNLKALETNLDWIIEQSYRAFEQADWEFKKSPPEDEEE
jgi:hypothetical protein